VKKTESGWFESVIPAEEERSGLSPHVLVLLICFLALTVRLILFFHGVRGSDAYVYASHAFDLATGRYTPLNLGGDYYGYRYTVIVPTAVAYWLFGVGDWASVLFPLIFGMGGILLVYRLGCVLFEEKTALWSAAVFAILPLSILFSTLLGPDSFIPFFSGLAVLALLEAERTSGTISRAGWLCLLGVSFYACVSARIVSVVFILFFAGYAICLKRGVFSYWMALALGLPLIIEGGCFIGLPAIPYTIGVRFPHLLVSSRVSVRLPSLIIRMP